MPDVKNSFKILAAIIIIVTASTVGVVLAFVTFSQTLPSVTVNPQFQLVPCSSALKAESPVTFGSGVILYDCSGSAAFTVSGGPGPATPSWPPIPTNPSGITVSLGVTSNGSCTAFTTLVNNTALTLGNAGYDYCLSYSNVPSSGGTIGPITVTWS